MQNTIVRRYLGNPNVATILIDQGGRNGETLDRLLLVWSNYFLRGSVLFDGDGATAGGVLGQPSTGLPFARGFILDREGRVVLPYFGYDPARILSVIDGLLAPPPRALRPAARALPSGRRNISAERAAGSAPSSTP